MQISVMGTGMVGRTIAGRLATLGHDVVIGTRDPGVSLARRQPDPMGVILPDWLAENPEIRLATFAEAAAHGSMVVNATSGAASIAALEAAGEAALDGKVLVDVSNELDFSRGYPPRVGATSEQSNVERIAARFPNVRVVKALNTMAAPVMVDPSSVGGGDHSVFISGDDPAAKAEVADLLRTFGWHDIIDLGGLATARGTELMMPIWLSLTQALGIPPTSLQFKVVR